MAVCVCQSEEASSKLLFLLFLKIFMVLLDYFHSLFGFAERVNVVVCSEKYSYSTIAPYRFLICSSDKNWRDVHVTELCQNTQNTDKGRQKSN